MQSVYCPGTRRLSHLTTPTPSTCQATEMERGQRQAVPGQAMRDPVCDYVVDTQPDLQKLTSLASIPRSAPFLHSSRSMRNIEQRRRTRALNEAYDVLRKRIPCIRDRRTRVSRLRTLQHAIAYIKHLEDAFSKSSLRPPPSQAAPPSTNQGGVSFGNESGAQDWNHRQWGPVDHEQTWKAFPAATVASAANCVPGIKEHGEFPGQQATFVELNDIPRPACFDTADFLTHQCDFHGLPVNPLCLQEVEEFVP